MDCVVAHLVNMNVDFRVLGPQEASAYQQLRLKSFQDDPFAFSESYEDECNRPLSDFEQELKTQGDPPEWFILGSFLESKLIGFVKFRRDPRSKARHKSMIHAMYVDTEYRGRSVGKALIDKVDVMARKLKGLEQIHLWVLHSDSSRSAVGFYKGMWVPKPGTLCEK